MIENKIKINLYIFILAFIILLTGILFNVKINIAGNIYPNSFILIIFAVFGFIFTIYISKIISKFDIITKTLAYIGQNTIPILCLHLFAFRFVLMIIVKYYNLDNFIIGSYNAYTPDDKTLLWLLLYFIFGISIPIIMAEVYRKTKRLFYKSNL